MTPAHEGAEVPSCRCMNGIEYEMTDDDRARLELARLEGVLGALVSGAAPRDWSAVAEAAEDLRRFALLRAAE